MHYTRCRVIFHTAFHHRCLRWPLLLAVHYKTWRHCKLTKFQRFRDFVVSYGFVMLGDQWNQSFCAVKPKSEVVRVER